MSTQSEVQRDVTRLSEIAKKRGLDFYPVNFEIINKKVIVEFGTYVLPNRFSHWTFGREYGRLQKFHDLGIMEILEMVINADPASAFLLDSNSTEENKMVIAHVFAHVDFFKNNHWFSRTNKQMLTDAKFYEERIRQLEEVYGKKSIEEVLDVCLSIQWYVDFYGTFASPEVKKKVIPKIDRSKYLLFPDDEDQKEGQPEVKKRTEHRDLLLYLIKNAPLEDHEVEVLEMIRNESLYFMPNAITKIMNEGWATYWHTEIMRDYLSFDEFDRFAIKHAELIGAEGLNPYKLGFLMFCDIKERWDNLNGEGAGLKKIFEVRKFEDDASFIRNYLTQEVCDKCGLYIYEKDPKTGQNVVASKDVEKIKDSILISVANLGKPVIRVIEKGDDDTALNLFHVFDGREMDIDLAGDVLRSLHNLWKARIVLETVVDGKQSFLTFDGEKVELATN